MQHNEALQTEGLTEGRRLCKRTVCTEFCTELPGEQRVNRRYVWTENPRVGSSILPLATAQVMVK
jgi:hypothetical protein